MNLNIKLFPTGDDGRFSKKSSVGVYITQNNINKLREQVTIGKHDVIYANLKINGKIDFTHQIDVLAKEINGDDGRIYIHQDLLKESYPENQEAIILPLDQNTLSLATDVTIDVDKNDVVKWSLEEVNHAKNRFIAKNTIIRLGNVELHPKTKPIVKGIITEIKSDKQGEFFLVDDSTTIDLTNLPDALQKVVDFEGIGGLDSVLQRLREIIQIPLNHPDLFERFNIKPYRGIILHGPPGNGKTMIARALSQSLGAKFFPIEGPELMSSHVSVGERKLIDTFEEASSIGKSIVFIDELDSIANSRSDDSQDYEIRFVSTLLNLMDGIDQKQGVFLIAATNRIESVDRAFRRPGRFDLDFEIPMPNQQARLEILKMHLKEEYCDANVNKVFFNDVASKTQDFSGADLVGLYRESAMNAITRNLIFDDYGKTTLQISSENIKISKKDFLDALNKFVPYVKRKDIKDEN